VPSSPVKLLASSSKRVMVHGRVEEGRVDALSLSGSLSKSQVVAAEAATAALPAVDDDSGPPLEVPDEGDTLLPPPEPVLSDDVVVRLLDPPPLPSSGRMPLPTFIAPPLPAESDVGTLPLLTPRAKQTLAAAQSGEVAPLSSSGASTSRPTARELSAFLAATDSASNTSIRPLDDESESESGDGLRFESLFAPEPESGAESGSSRRSGSSVQSKGSRGKRSTPLTAAPSPSGSPQPPESKTMRRTVSPQVSRSGATPSPADSPVSSLRGSRRRRDSVAKAAPTTIVSAVIGSSGNTRRRSNSHAAAAAKDLVSQGVCYIALQPPRADVGTSARSGADSLAADGMVCVSSVRSCIAVTTLKPKALLELLEQALAGKPGVEFARINPLAVRAIDAHDGVRVEFAIVTIGRRGQLFGISCRRVQGEPFQFKKTLQAIVGAMHLETKINSASIDHVLASEVGAVAAAATGVGAHRIDLTRIADSSVDSDVGINEQLKEMRANEALLTQQIAVMDKKMDSKLTKPERKRMEALLANLKVDLQDVRSKLQGLEVVATGDLAAIALSLSEASESRARLELQLQEAGAVLANVKAKKSDRQKVEETLPALNASLDVVRARIELLEVARTRLTQRNAAQLSPLSASNAAAAVTGSIVPKRRRHRRSGAGAAGGDGDHSEDSETPSSSHHHK
jgi:hypothetical protein